MDDRKLLILMSWVASPESEGKVKRNVIGEYIVSDESDIDPDVLDAIRAYNYERRLNNMPSRPDRL